MKLDYEEIGRRIKQAREQQGLTQPQLAAILNYTSATVIHGWEAGKRHVSLDDLLKLVNVLHKPFDYFMGKEIPGSPNAPDPTDLLQQRLGQILGVDYVPLLGNIAAGRPIVAMENLTTKKVPVPIDLPFKPDFALKTQGDSMIDAGIEEGSLVFIKRQDYVDFSGQIAAVVLGEEATLKYVFAADDGTYWLVPANKKYRPVQVKDIADAHIIGIYAGAFKYAPIAAPFAFTPPQEPQTGSYDFGDVREEDKV